MTTIRIKRLALQNFKGVKDAAYDFGGKNAAIYGKNGTGKTSVCDAWCWLMTGKDSQGRVPADNGGFAIKPLAPDGSVADRAARTTVEAVIDADGREIILRREYYERWTSKRGADEASYDGNSTDYYINEVPMSKSLYEERVAELVPLDTLRLLSDVTAFPRMGDKDRRSILFDLAGLSDERAIMETDSRFAPLLAATEHISLTDCQKQQQALRRKANDQRSHIPDRIDEVNKSILELSEIPFDELRHSAADLERERECLDAQISDVSDQTGPIRLEISELEQQRMALKLDNERYRAAQQAQQPDIAGLEQQILRQEVGYKYDSQRYHAAKKEAERYDSLAEQCRTKWREIKCERYPGNAICPTCGQELPAEKQAEARKAWDEDRDRRLNRVRDEGERYAVCARRECERVDALKEQMILCESEIAKAKDELAAAKNTTTHEITDKPGYQEQMQSVEAKLDELRNELSAAQEDRYKHTSTLKSRRNAVADEIKALNAQIAKEDILYQAKERVLELQQQTKTISGQIADADRALDLIEQFTRYRASYVTGTINSQFSLAEFRLFRAQVNGGLVDCCDILYQGVPYNAGLNTGAKINVGLDIINTLSRHYGIRVPVFVDQAESVTGLCAPDESQVIRLVVSEDDEKVRFETE